VAEVGALLALLWLVFSPVRGIRALPEPGMLATVTA
jgi:hypothetical protein